MEGTSARRAQREQKSSRLGQSGNHSVNSKQESNTRRDARSISHQARLWKFERKRQQGSHSAQIQAQESTVVPSSSSTGAIKRANTASHHVAAGHQRAARDQQRHRLEPRREARRRALAHRVRKQAAAAASREDDEPVV
mgnify:CR=1 FL=1